MKDITLLGFIISTCAYLAVQAEYEELCVRFADNVQFREPGNCKAYVKCENGVGTVTECPNNQIYDKDNSKCVSKLTDSYCDALCSAANEGKWVADPLSCEGFYYCRNGEALHGKCPDGYNFSEDDQLCDFPSDSPCFGVPDFCKLLPNKIKFSDPEACNKYYMCSSKKQVVQTCGTDLYFDVTAGECMSKYNVACDVHPIPAGICGKDKTIKVNETVSDGVTCRGYFYCAYMGPNLPDPNPKWYQCPEGTFFDGKICGEPTLISCASDRCDGRGNNLVLAENEYCQHYHICKDGKTTGLGKCPRDMFFNESAQSCVYDEITSPICDF